MALIAAVLIAAGCTGGDPGGPTRTRGASVVPGPSTARVLISPADGSRQVAPERRVRVTAIGATLRAVEVRGGAHRLGGTYTPGRQRWQSTGPLHVGSRYTVAVTALDAAGRTLTARGSFRTLVPAATITATIAQRDGAAYGVGMPILIGFDRPVRDRAAVERALRVTTSRPVVGAWYWPDDRHVRFRPRDYWPAHLTVSVGVALDGVRAAPEVYGTAELHRSFRTGSSSVVVASTVSHRLQFYRDGALIHDWPISTGRPGHDTPNGTYLTIDKGNPVEMRPADVAPGEPGYYDLWVPWAVRFTWSGYYLHGAPWSVAEQGHTNVSHGCVNLPPAAAETYYRTELPGDPVTITGSPVAGDPGSGWTDWFLSWPALLARGALHRAVVAGPDGDTLVDPGAVPASTATPPTGRPEAGNAAAGS